MFILGQKKKNLKSWWSFFILSFSPLSSFLFLYSETQRMFKLGLVSGQFVDNGGGYRQNLKSQHSHSPFSLITELDCMQRVPLAACLLQHLCQERAQNAGLLSDTTVAETTPRRMNTTLNSKTRDFNRP